MLLKLQIWVSPPNVQNFYKFQCLISNTKFKLYCLAYLAPSKKNATCTYVLHILHIIGPTEGPPLTRFLGFGKPRVNGNNT